MYRPSTERRSPAASGAVMRLVPYVYPSFPSGETTAESGVQANVEPGDGSGARDHLSNRFRAYDDRLPGEYDAGIGCPIGDDAVYRSVSVSEPRPVSISGEQGLSGRADMPAGPTRRSTAKRCGAARTRRGATGETAGPLREGSGKPRRGRALHRRSEQPAPSRRMSRRGGMACQAAWPIVSMAAGQRRSSSDPSK